MKSPREPIESKDRKRLLIVSIGVFFLFSTLILQFFKVQIIQGEDWAELAHRQHERVITEPFRRGTFFSNTTIKKGHPERAQPFAIDVAKFHLHVDPNSIGSEHRDQVAERLAKLVELPEEEWEEFRSQFDKKSRNRRLHRWLSRELKEAILHWWRPYARKNKIPRNAIFFFQDYQRSYPFGKLLGQVLHTIRDYKDEDTKEGIPTGGLESAFNEYLRGEQGLRWLVRSSRNPLEIGDVLKPAEHGADIYLTVNHYLQAIAEEELALGVKQAQAEGGWALIMDPHSGEILALAQYPFFSPANYQKFFNDPDRVDDTRAKAVTDLFEPGSIMKPITLAIALTANEVVEEKGLSPLFQPEEKMATSSGAFPGRGSKPLRDGRVHYFLNSKLALQKSSNIYFANLVQRVIGTLGDDWYREALVERFGFGQETGIELPGESAGLVPKPGRRHPNGRLEWSKPTPYSLAMGYNLMAHAVQMARAFAVFANGGYLVEPTLIKKISRVQDDGNQVLLLNHDMEERKKNFPKVLSDNVVSQVVSSMKYVTKWGGTSRRADIEGFTECGKSGTSEKITNGLYSKKHHISSFVGFTPVDGAEELSDDELPRRLVVVVVIDDPLAFFTPGVGKNHLGGTCAAPVFRRIAKRSLEYLGITPDDPYGYPRGDPRSNPEKADWIQEVKMLQEIYKQWNES